MKPVIGRRAGSGRTARLPGEGSFPGSRCARRGLPATAGAEDDLVVGGHAKMAAVEIEAAFRPLAVSPAPRPGASGCPAGRGRGCCRSRGRRIAARRWAQEGLAIGEVETGLIARLPRDPRAQRHLGELLESPSMDPGSARRSRTGRCRSERPPSGPTSEGFPCLPREEGQCSPAGVAMCVRTGAVHMGGVGGCGEEPERACVPIHPLGAERYVVAPPASRPWWEAWRPPGHPRVRVEEEAAEQDAPRPVVRTSARESRYERFAASEKPAATGPWSSSRKGPDPPPSRPID